VPETVVSSSASVGATATVREITQQPAIWGSVSDIVDRNRGALDSFLADLMENPRLRVVLTGAGTSAFVGSIAAPALARTLGRRVDAVATTDIVSDPHGCFPEDIPTLLVSFARSGNSPESSAATELADQVLSDVRHLVLTCNENGRLFSDHTGREKSFVLLMPARSNDEGFAMTSSFTSMLLAVLLVLDGANHPAVTSLAASATQILESRREAIVQLAARRFERVVYLGSGPLAGLATESALKLLELTAGRVVSYHDSALGFRHGPKAVLNDKTLVIVFVSSDPYTRLYDLDILTELRAGSPANVIAISAGPLAESDANTWVLQDAAGLGDAFAAVTFAVIAQLLGLSFALELGVTPDNPFPGGAVNRVVQGVHIHSLDESNRA
jgi:tagatose-6-phosphate ketose/aldose isomerase